MEQIRIARNDSGELTAVILPAGEPVRVKPVRCFPLLAPETQIALFPVLPDGTLGKELAILRNYSGIGEGGRRLIEEELHKTNVLTPIIRIMSIREVERKFRWVVLTHEGRMTFDVNDPRDLFVINFTIAIVRDVKGNRYSLDTTKLEPKSRMLLEAYT